MEARRSHQAGLSGCTSSLLSPSTELAASPSMSAPRLSSTKTKVTRSPSRETPAHSSMVAGSPDSTLTGLKAAEPMVAPALPHAAEKPLSVERMCGGKAAVVLAAPELHFMGADPWERLDVQRQCDHIRWFTSWQLVRLGFDSCAAYVDGQLAKCTLLHPTAKGEGDADIPDAAQDGCIVAQQLQQLVVHYWQTGLATDPSQGTASVGAAQAGTSSATDLVPGVHRQDSRRVAQAEAAKAETAAVRAEIEEARAETDRVRAAVALATESEAKAVAERFAAAELEARATAERLESMSAALSTSSRFACRTMTKMRPLTMTVPTTLSKHTTATPPMPISAICLLDMASWMSCASTKPCILRTTQLPSNSMRQKDPVRASQLSLLRRYGLACCCTNMKIVEKSSATTN